MVKVAHLTSVHPAHDTRIFHKECRSLAEAGYEVVLVVPDDCDKVKDGIKIRAVPRPQGRLKRMTRTVRHVYRAAVAEDADIYHFHDPELIPVGLMLRRRGKPVVYDVHENYITSIRQKPYLPRPVRSLLAAIWDKPELLLSKPFQIVLAESYYAERFPEGTTVLNYPIREYFSGLPIERRGTGLLFTGVLSQDRGALLYAQIAECVENIEMHVVGRCPQELADRMYQVAGRGKSRLHIDVLDAHVPYQRVLSSYRQDNWLAALAVYPPTAHYMEKEPTKLFEYMGAGIPIICSDFPAWRSLVQGTGAGLCVDPLDFDAVTDAIRYLASHPDEARRMGKKGRHAFETQYNWTSEVEKLLALYDGLARQAKDSV